MMMMMMMMMMMIVYSTFLQHKLNYKAKNVICLNINSYIYKYNCKTYHISLF